MKTFSRSGIFVLVASLAMDMLCASPAYCAIRYAKSDGATAGDCNTWANACTLERAKSRPNTDQVWVKSGTYGPLALQNGVKIIGGFAGTETLASQSNPAVNVTTISGNDAEQCVFSNGDGPTTMLRGFRIANCHAGNDWDGGGGLVLTSSSALFVRCVFENNTAMRFGAAVSIHGTGSPQFINCDFHNNGSGSAGSAQDNNVEPLAGGAVFLHSGSPSFVNCLFYGNKAGEGAGIAIASGSPSFVNCTFTTNYAKIGYGGAINDKWAKGSLRNCILWDNTAIKGGGEVFNAPTQATPITYSDVKGGWSGTGNINSDPVFVSAHYNNYQLQCDSPCRDAGINSSPSLPDDIGDLDWDTVTSEPIPKDLAFSSRVVSSVVEMGAYELQYCAE